MNRKIILVVLILVWLAGCGGGRAGTDLTTTSEITVLAASSLTDAFNEIAVAFTAQNPDVRVALNFAGSSQLAAQLGEGVTADVFASANAAQMTAVIATGRITPGTEVVFVSNRLAIIVPADNPAGVTSLADLARPGVKLILAVPGVPVRTYTDEIVSAMPPDFQTGFYDNLVSEEDNVRQVSAKIALGEADAGIVYTSDVTPDIAGDVQQIAIPDAQNVAAAYPIAPLADAPHPELAQRFIDFVLSDAGQAILVRWGFGPPPTR